MNYRDDEKELRGKVGRLTCQSPGKGELMQAMGTVPSGS